MDTFEDDAALTWLVATIQKCKLNFQIAECFKIFLQEEKMKREKLLKDYPEPGTAEHVLLPESSKLKILDANFDIKRINEVINFFKKNVLGN
jgi:hypothetical protein